MEMIWEIRYHYIRQDEIKKPWGLNINVSKINRIYRKVEGYSNPEKHYEPIQGN